MQDVSSAPVASRLSLSDADKTRFLEMSRSLAAIGSHEGNFIKIELIFFEALETARKYGEAPANNSLLAQLYDLKAGAYSQTAAHFNKRTMRERVIQKFITQLRKVLTAKTAFLN